MPFLCVTHRQIVSCISPVVAFVIPHFGKCYNIRLYFFMTAHVAQVAWSISTALAGQLGHSEQQ